MDPRDLPGAGRRGRECHDPIRPELVRRPECRPSPAGGAHAQAARDSRRCTAGGSLRPRARVRRAKLRHTQAHPGAASGGGSTAGTTTARAGADVCAQRGRVARPPVWRAGMELNHQLAPKLKQLRLSGILATLSAREQQAIDGQWAYGEFLERLLEDEVERRAQKQLALRVRRATLNTTKTLEDFDWSFNPSISRQHILRLASCEYVRRKRNLLICGPTGVGKSHLAQALAHEACRQGFDVLFVNTHKMLQHIHGGRADGSYEKRLASYLRPELLILDDFGLKPLSERMPSDLYDVMNERYEVGSILVTSNRAPEEWPDLFGDPLLASAGLDRLAHQAETLVITGRSFRAGRVVTSTEAANVG